ncbi:hypothetical protein Dda_4199 [Drechslerella dactyloides]|uniref:Uncharacterized protein n=1 Tax=Drechslerella dactyloides TaxID=74499 RepID=A0AAD6J0T8_DREDA|nr:hypothetical protein Dda_4199 [Drechslerella dactyloides]
MPCKVSPIWTLVPEDEEWSDDTFVSNVFNHSYMKWRWNLRWQSRHLDGWLDKWYWYNGTSADRGLGWMLYEWQLRRDAMRPPLDSQNNVSKLISVLKRDRLQSFCKKYVNYKPGDVRKVVRTATATTCTNGNRRCIPTTITPVVQTTITSTTTITVDEGTVTDYIYTTPTTTIETTITSTVDTVTSTYTVGSPQLRKRKAPKPPSCIRSCAPNKISAACSTLVIPLITTTRTTTVRGTVRTVIANARTTTITVPITVYSVLPGQTVTNTKTKPTQTETVTRTEDVTFTTTETVCPSRTPGAFAIGVVHNGPDTPAYIQPEAGSEVNCGRIMRHIARNYGDRLCIHESTTLPIGFHKRRFKIRWASLVDRRRRRNQLPRRRQPWEKLTLEETGAGATMAPEVAPLTLIERIRAANRNGK